MKKFKDEVALGGLIDATNTVTYTVAVASSQKDPVPNINQQTPDTEDLFYIRGILVSNIWNLNDDVFSSEDMWTARKTAVDKPVNIEHDAATPIGHITSQWAINGEDQSLIDDESDIEDLPELFHLGVGAVIYSKCRVPEKQQMVSDTIGLIKDNKRYLSMEVSFSGFDYAIRKPGSPVHIVPRNEATAFLTEKLRCYGGQGMHDGWSIGRVLRGLNFVGVGVVEKPGNPDSVIFVADEKISKFSFANANSGEKIGVYKDRVEVVSTSSSVNIDINREKFTMEADLKQELAEARKTIDTLRDEISKANVVQIESELAEARQTIESLKTKVGEVESAKACMCSQYEELVGEKELVDQELADLRAKLQSVEEAKKAEARIKVFTDKGYSIEEARERSEKMSKLVDSDFDQIAALIPAKQSVEAFVAPEATETVEEDVEVVASTVEQENLSPATVEVDAETETITLARKALESIYTNRWVKKEK